MVQKKDIHEAQNQIASIIHQTPLIHSRQLSSMSGNQIYLKGEHLQKTGSFKIRGATNKVKHAVNEGAKHVLTASSGNHGQAVAYIAKVLGIQATIVVPEDVNNSKAKAMTAYNGRIEKCGHMSEERLARAKELAKETNGTYVPPYDDKRVVAGQGTIGLELLDQLDNIDVIVVPIGGGGLIAGLLTAIKLTKPSIKVIGVEPQSAHDTYMSLEKGVITSIKETTTIADGLRTNQPGEFTFPIINKYVDDIVLVSELEIKEALFVVLERTKQLIEPSSAVTVAAAIFDKLNVKNKHIVCIASGGNVDLHHIHQLFPTK